jgi:hypothetical protein
VVERAQSSKWSSLSRAAIQYEPNFAVNPTLPHRALQRRYRRSDAHVLFPEFYLLGDAHFSGRLVLGLTRQISGQPHPFVPIPWSVAFVHEFSVQFAATQFHSYEDHFSSRYASRSAISRPVVVRVSSGGHQMIKQDRTI